MSTQLTTGEVYGRLFKDLVSNGIPLEVAEDIVREGAIHELREAGYVIRNEEEDGK